MKTNNELIVSVEEISPSEFGTIAGGLVVTPLAVAATVFSCISGLSLLAYNVGYAVGKYTDL